MPWFFGRGYTGPFGYDTSDRRRHDHRHHHHDRHRDWLMHKIY